MNYEFESNKEFAKKMDKNYSKDKIREDKIR
jgi:hypothetical protein